MLQDLTHKIPSVTTSCIQRLKDTQEKNRINMITGTGRTDNNNKIMPLATFKWRHKIKMYP